MYRRIASIVALAALIAGIGMSPVFAQDEKSLHFGIKAGINISDFRGDEIEGFAELIDWKAGFCGGVFMSYAVNDWFSLQPELLYSMKGMKFGILSKSLFSISLDYIEIPVLAVVKLPTQSELKPFVFGGPVIGFKVRASGGATFFDEDYSVDMSDYANTTEFSLAMGVGINVVIANREMTLEGRYVPGLTNAFKDIEAEGHEQEFPWKNDTISILLGLAF